MDNWKDLPVATIEQVRRLFHSHRYQSVRQQEPLSAQATPSSPTSSRRFRYPFKWSSKYLLAVATLLAIILALVLIVLGRNGTQQNVTADKPRPKFVWQTFPLEKGYFEGLGNFVPNDSEQSATGESHQSGKNGQPYPIPFKYDPFSLQSSSLTAPPVQCFLDDEKEIPAPPIWAYNGALQHAPEPMLGSHDAMGLNKDVCFDRHGRYAAYGLGYEVEKGGTGLGMQGDRKETESTLNVSSLVDWRNINIARAQSICNEKNRHRFPNPLYPYRDDAFHQADTWPGTPKPASRDNFTVSPTEHHTLRTAVVLRLWDQYQWTPNSHLYLRSLISELNLHSGAEYTIHLLIQIKDNTPIWASDEIYNASLQRLVPPEYRDLATLWSEDLMRLIYPGPFEPQFNRPGPIHSVGRSMHMALQWFATHHPEYDFFWNWEMDIRYVGHWYELFDRVGKWAEDQPRRGLWERSGRFYVPGAHGNWEAFVNDTETRALNGGEELVYGPQYFPGWEEDDRIDVLGDNYHSRFHLPDFPSTTSSESSALEEAEFGIGEPADYITFLPMFQPARTFWIFRADVSGFSTALPIPPRRASIVTASRFSSRLLRLTHAETSIARHSMCGEMFPASVSLHHGLKAAFAPHPMFFNRAWNSSQYVEGVFNADTATGQAGGNSESVFSELPQHNFRGGTYYYDAGFAGRLWRRWLGIEEADERGRGGGRGDGSGSGRMCLRSVLLHPVKWEEGDD